MLLNRKPIFKNKIWITEAHSEASQTWSLYKNVELLKAVIFFAKSSIFDVFQGAEYGT